MYWIYIEFSGMTGICNEFQLILIYLHPNLIASLISSAKMGPAAYVSANVSAWYNVSVMGLNARLRVLAKSGAINNLIEMNAISRYIH